MKKKFLKTGPQLLDVIDELITDGVNKGIGHLLTKDKHLTGNNLLIDVGGHEKKVVNFGSCSYLGLEFDPRIREASKQAIDDYGTFFSTSRTYISSRYYKELEDLLSVIFSASAVVAPTTTLGHMAAIPVILGEKDAILLDHQVHNSVHMAVSLVKSKGVHTELIRHNRIDLLEEKIKTLRVEYDQIWYMADGIYSMFGDAAMIPEIINLLNKYEDFHFYVDDAHGMSCFGKHGSGYVLSQTYLHERMILITSLAKGFGTGGAALIFPDPETARKVKTCGGPMITSGPLQPAVLGAAIASARIHLTDEIYKYQNELSEKIRFTRKLILEEGLPLISESDSAVFFVGVSLPKIGYSMVQRMLSKGHLVNLGIFPAVPLKNTGIRFTITRQHTITQIEKMISDLAISFKETLEEMNVSLDTIYNAFHKSSHRMKAKYTPRIETSSKLHLTHFRSISDFDHWQWDALMSANSSFNAATYAFYEKTFRGNILPKDNWEFDYIIIRDDSGNPILASALCTGLGKDDMLAPPGISRQMENMRQNFNPYYLTSKVITTGNFLSTGNPLFQDRSSPLWPRAWKLFMEKLTEIQEREDAESIVIRDLPQGDTALDALFADNGFLKINMADNHVISELKVSGKEDLLQHLSNKSKRSARYMKQDVFRHEHKFEVELLKEPSSAEIEHLFSLYLDVNKNSFEMNSFPLPYKLFEQIASDPDWEIISLKLKPEYDSRTIRKPVSVTFNYVSGNTYHFVLTGIDYSFNKEHMCYKQAVYQTYRRACAIGKQSLILGYTTSYIKIQTFGAEILPSVAYIQTRDNYALEVISSSGQEDLRKQNKR